MTSKAIFESWPKASAKCIEQIFELYANRRVVVTGGASFIGSHLVDALLGMNCQVVVLDNFSSGKMSNLDTSNPKLHIINIDLEHEQNLKQHFDENDVVFHLAAIHGGRGFIEKYPNLVLGNLGIDNNVFKAAVVSKVTRIVHASSACAYPLHQQVSLGSSLKLSENDSGSMDEPGAFPDGSYGWTKLIGEYQLRTHTANTQTTGRSARIFTAYGERENESHAAIALIAKALLQMDPFTIWGTGLQTRNFTYVTDTVRGLLNLGIDSSPNAFDIQNIGTSEFVTVNEFINTIFELIGWMPMQVFRDESKPQGVASRASDNASSISKFDWEPTVSIEEGLSRTINWYKQQVNRPKSLIDLEVLLESR
jgi:nucleoside-diphosphate-sugar epimerase